MLLATFQRVEEIFKKHDGYASASQLKGNNVSTLQIRELVDKNIIEHVSHGFYWMKDIEGQKPENYEMIEACMINKHAVICADSACYYHGLLSKKPALLSVATKKVDRSKMKLNFPVKRHYYSTLTFEQDIEEKKTKYGIIYVYGKERSICDAIRFRDDLEPGALQEILSNCKFEEKEKLERMLAYADAMRVGKIVRKYLEID